MSYNIHYTSISTLCLSKIEFYKSLYIYKLIYTFLLDNMKFSRIFSCKSPRVEYDYRHDILSVIKSNTMYIKSAILFKDDNNYQYGEYSLKFSSTFETGRIGLCINVHNYNVLKDAETVDECIICTEETKTCVKCCKKHICHCCISKLNQNDGNLYKCPHCRQVPILSKRVVLKDNDLDIFFEDDVSLDRKLTEIENIIS